MREPFAKQAAEIMKIPGPDEAGEPSVIVVETDCPLDAINLVDCCSRENRTAHRRNGDRQPLAEVTEAPNLRIEKIVLRVGGRAHCARAQRSSSLWPFCR